MSGRRNGPNQETLVVYLAKEGSKSADAPYVIPGGIITGGFNGPLVLIWTGKKI
jgi:hypothetical protein